MQLPLQITFHNMAHSDAIEKIIREKAEKLDRHASISGAKPGRHAIQLQATPTACRNLGLLEVCPSDLPVNTSRHRHVLTGFCRCSSRRPPDPPRTAKQRHENTESVSRTREAEERPRVVIMVIVRARNGSRLGE